MKMKKFDRFKAFRVFSPILLAFLFGVSAHSMAQHASNEEAPKKTLFGAFKAWKQKRKESKEDKNQKAQSRDSASSEESDCEIRVTKLNLVNTYKTRDFNPKTKQLELMPVEEELGKLINSEDIGVAEALVVTSFDARLVGKNCPQQSKDLRLVLVSREQDRVDSAQDDEADLHSKSGIKGELKNVQLYSSKIRAEFSSTLEKYPQDGGVPLANLIRNRLKDKHVESLSFQLLDEDDKVVFERSLEAHFH
ncbi:hypothetical protein GW915_04240 [bacterium]|nr:hypothetical protein [bacterium]